MGERNLARPVSDAVRRPTAQSPGARAAAQPAGEPPASRSRDAAGDRARETVRAVVVIACTPADPVQDCCSAPRLDADRRGNVLILLDAGGSNADA